ncbi:hypothetical protein NQZ68_011927 [Dissostichus eleginoides]|nr:hypothetical protein NQZ68_011927 [Dissostichus eleginoides]
MTTPGQEEKRYDPTDTTLKFVNKPDVLDAYPPEELCAEMSCGHAVTPQSFTAWCRSLLDQGQYKFKCPDRTDGIKCGKDWPYQEVRRLALLTAEEMAYFEENIARLAATEYCEFKRCPGCETYVEREDQSNLSVRCTICMDEKKKVYEFCWQCLNEWKGRRPRSDRCGNDGCINAVLELLKICKTTALSQVQGVTACPSIRACPTCGQKVEHDTLGCKNIICPRCQVEFCFVCLKLTPECLETSTHFKACSAGVAPRQTSIPVWHQN